MIAMILPNFGCCIFHERFYFPRSKIS